VKAQHIPVWLSLPLALALVFVLSFVLSFPPLDNGVALAQSAPAPCRLDNGQALRPGSLGWAMLLNFNHAPSTTSTIGCVAALTAANPNQVNYRLITCTVVNNLNNTPVGSGNASFDGNYWIECPAMGQGVVVLQSFLIYGRAQFLNSNATYSLVNHQDAKFRTTIDAAWHATLTSRYGATTFANTDSITNFLGKTAQLKSGVDGITGRHAVDQTVLQPEATITAFSFDYGKPIIVGAQGQSWVLYEILIDPPGRCCGQS
jgi:hypothetical protein